MTCLTGASSNRAAEVKGHAATLRTKGREIFRPLVERFALLIELVVDLVGCFHALARMIEDALRDFDFHAQARETGASGAA